MTKPNFIIIGAAKSGTTALWHQLRQHPEIYMSARKHTRFFSFGSENPSFSGPGPRNPSIPYAISGIENYHALFDGAKDETAIGEASHSYLYKPEAPRRIREYAPDMKLVAVLRNPTERAYSHYRQMVRDGREPLDDFVMALKEEDARIADRWWPDFHYVQLGLYYLQLRRYFDVFARDQVRVYLYEDFRAEPMSMLRDIFQFLEVDDTFVPEAAISYNASGIPKNRIIHSSLQGLRRVKPAVRRVVPEGHYRFMLRVGSKLHNQNLVKPRLSSEVRTWAMGKYFREDVVMLQALIQRDLSAWLDM